MKKKGATKVPLSKQIWQWTENTSPDEITAEHVYTAYRLRIGKCNTCRKNCSANPTCLRGLGEGAWMRECNYQNSLEDDVKDLNDNIRQDGKFVGLKNLGATCYVNTFLQLWFHNLNFRRAVYSYVEETKEGEKFPSTVCGHLQLLFGMLESTVRKSVDPSPFVKCLGLDTDLQQDAQEFSKLLLNLLDRTSEVGNFLCKEFCGEYDYCTKCKYCGNVSKNGSKFYELDLSIQGHKDIKGCLEEYFKEELLENENQYHCDNCDCRRDASRQIVIKSFPQTLNLQLLRFVFDKTTWNKKKLSSYISFPDILDMSPYIPAENLSPNGAVYELTAVLIHRGPSASSGHYIAHIKDSSTQLWNRFNDESVENLKSGKKLDLDAATNDDYEADMPQPVKKPKLQKNAHSSKDAYMLVYLRKEQNSLVNITPKVPVIVQESVHGDNDDFHATIQSMIADVHKESEERTKHHKEVSAVLKDMHEMGLSELTSECFWVPTTWLKHMLNGAETVKKTFSMDKFTCSHKKLDPDKVGSMKCISSLAAEFFFKLCKEDVPHVKNDMLCHECVKNRCFISRRKASLNQDQEMVKSALKESGGVTEGFLIGRSSLRYWKTMAMQQLQEESGKNEEKDDGAVDDGEKAKNTVECDSTDEDVNFNEELLCEHGNLTTDTKEYRIIPEVVWVRIAKYFPDAKVYKTDSSLVPCQICTDEQHDAMQAAQLQKVMVSEQKSRLNNLFHNKKRPTFEDLFRHDAQMQSNTPSFYAVSFSFIRNWRDYLQNPSKNVSASNINNSILLCPHKKLVFNVFSSLNDNPSGMDEKELGLVLLWPDEWDYISKNFIIDTSVSIRKELTLIKEQLVNGEKHNSDDSVTKQEVIVLDDSNLANCKDHTTKLEGEDTQITANITSSAGNMDNESEKVILKYEPDLCEQCIVGRRLEKELGLRYYEDEEIYVRKVIPDETPSWKREIFSECDNSTTTRKSKRSHAARGEKKITVSSSMTLKQLKIKIMQVLFTPPYDQNLWMNGVKLLQDELSLGQLSVTPKSTVFLIADEPDEKSLEMLPVVDEKKPVMEEGFKGTGLLSS